MISAFSPQPGSISQQRVEKFFSIDSRHLSPNLVENLIQVLVPVRSRF